MEAQDRPPLFPRWGYWYALVVGALLLQVLLYALLTKAYS